eukprot:355085_1
MINYLHNLALVYSVALTTYLFHHHINTTTRLTDSDISTFDDVVSYDTNRKLLAKQVTVTIESEIAIGSILLWSGNSDNIPENWLLCDGRNNTPNLTDKFVIGAGNMYVQNSNGGERNIKLSMHQLPPHYHVLTNDSISIEESNDEHYHEISNEDIVISLNNGHKHIISTDNISINGQHTHAYGDYILSHEGQHTHDIVQILSHINSSTNTSYDYVSNDIKIAIDTTSLEILTNGAHSHSVSGSTGYTNAHSYATVSGLGLEGGIVLGGGNGFANGALTAGHTHSISGSTNYIGSHAHDLSGDLSINIYNLSTDSIGLHSHTISGKNGASGEHAHELYTMSDLSGMHTHLFDGATQLNMNSSHIHDIIFGETDNVGDGDIIDIINPYYALYYIIKVSNNEFQVGQYETDTNSVDIDTTNLSPLIVTVITILILVLICLVVFVSVYGLKWYKKRRKTAQVPVQQNYGVAMELGKSVDVVGGAFGDVVTVVKNNDDHELVDEIDNINKETLPNISSNCEGV